MKINITKFSMKWFNKEDKGTSFTIKAIHVFAWDKARANKKKYSTVFDRNLVNYIGVHVELYNKLFDEDDWEVNLTFKAFKIIDVEQKENICEEKQYHVVTKDKNIVSFEYGWGNKEYGKFWEEGTYQWHVFINGDLVHVSEFIIQDVGIVSLNENPYFEVLSLQTYEADENNIKEKERHYLKQFKVGATRYIMGELKFKSKIDRVWECELFFNFYDDSGLLVGNTIFKGKIAKNKSDETVNTITIGWGNSSGTSWIKDRYRLEVVFMDTVVAIIPFNIGNQEIERSNNEAIYNEQVATIYNYNLETQSGSKIFKNDKSKDELKSTLDEAFAKLEALVGLENVKEKIKEYTDYIKYLKFRESKGITDDESVSLHSVFTGNPGTGKTTVVQLLGKIYYSLGLLSKGHVHTVASNDLIAGYVRQTGENTKKVIEKARGGILFIDEAYMLYKEDSPNDYGPEAIAALLTEMSNKQGDIAIMFAGYPVEMERFIHSNPGLKSRIKQYYHFNDFTPSQLIEIAEYAANKRSVSIHEDALIKLKKIITKAYRERDKTFGNARLVNNLVDEAKMNLGIRLMRDYKPEAITEDLLSLIMAEDIEAPIPMATVHKLELETDTILLAEALEDLNTLIGLEQIKVEVQELVRLTQYYKETKRNVLKAFSLHSIFLGNPGTGKTTVARIVGKLYKALGLLERGHIVEVDASDLIAAYVGQTAIKTKEIIKKAMGGILFIDEAYAITEGDNSNSYGKEAVAALIKEMEDHRGEFGVIVAGYTDNMTRFIETNPGMKSRFDRTFNFLDFTEDELWEIVLLLLKRKDLKPDDKAVEHLKKYIAHLYKNRNKFFGNARSMRKIVEKAFRNQELRMAAMDKNKRTQEMMRILTLEDVLEFDINKLETSTRKSIGFK